LVSYSFGGGFAYAGAWSLLLDPGLLVAFFASVSALLWLVLDYLKSSSALRLQDQLQRNCM